MTPRQQVRLSNTERRNRVLCAMEDGEFRDTSIAAWAELSDQQTRADLRWLEREGFAHHGELDDGRWWNLTDKGYDYVNGLPAEEKTW
jgi:hypothetical protein